MTSNASSARPPWAVGSVSGPMAFMSSRIEPGQPWVMISGMAFGLRERTCTNWMSSPSMRVTNIGKAFSFASTFRQS